MTQCIRNEQQLEKKKKEEELGSVARMWGVCGELTSTQLSAFIHRGCFLTPDALFCYIAFI